MFYHINAVILAREQAMVKTTKSKQDAAWKYWFFFTNRVSLSESWFLEEISKFQKNIMVCFFVQEIWEASLSKGNSKYLVEETVSSTISYVAQAFKTNNKQDSSLDADTGTCFLFPKNIEGTEIAMIQSPNKKHSC